MRAAFVTAGSAETAVHVHVNDHVYDPGRELPCSRVPLGVLG